MAHSARHRGGFATLAYPAEFGNSGIMSFIVSHHGKVYERDLGEETGSRRVRPRGARPCRLDSIRRLGAKGGITSFLVNLLSRSCRTGDCVGACPISARALALFLLRSLVFWTTRARPVFFTCYPAARRAC